MLFCGKILLFLLFRQAFSGFLPEGAESPFRPFWKYPGGRSPSGFAPKWPLLPAVWFRAASGAEKEGVSPFSRGAPELPENMFYSKFLNFFTKKSGILLLVLRFLTYLCNTYYKKGAAMPGSVVRNRVINKTKLLIHN